MNRPISLSVMAFLAMLFAFKSEAADFSHTFRDSTLRVNCIAGANNGDRFVAVSNAAFSRHWGGRRVNPAKNLLRGNARATMTDSLTGDTIYAHAFSSLFNEWLTLPEADSTSQAFEFTLDLPMPRRAADVAVTFFDAGQKPTASARWHYSPDDIQTADNTRKKPYRHMTLHHADSSEISPVNVAILAEGYTHEETDLFLEQAGQAVEAILSHEPFASMAQRFNFIAVVTPSDSTGVSIPRTGRWAKTAFDSRFSTFGSDRYLTTAELHTLHSALDGIPAEHIIVLANTDEYGGGGIYNNYTLTAAGHANFKPVVVHEFGHSFGGLADEYFYENDVMEDSYPTDIEPWEQNITTLKDFHGKWENLRNDNGDTPLVEGAAYSAHGVYRCEEDCRMRTNTASEFCAACRQALTRLIDSVTREQNR